MKDETCGENDEGETLQLTKRQEEILGLIRQCIDDTGMPPTRAEIAETLGFRSPNAAEDHLRALAKKGAIELLPGASRGIRLTEPSGLPVIGQVAAGVPILAVENIEDHYKMDAELFHPRADYLLRVNGQSMRDIGIRNGDLLAVHRQDTADNGQIVVARIDEAVTVKEFRQRGNQVTLKAKNPDFEDIKIDLRKEELSIEGLGVGILRDRLTSSRANAFKL